jgi:hypothetical protein
MFRPAGYSREGALTPRAWEDRVDNDSLAVGGEPVKVELESQLLLVLMIIHLRPCEGGEVHQRSISFGAHYLCGAVRLTDARRSATLRIRKVFP